MDPGSGRRMKIMTRAYGKQGLIFRMGSGSLNFHLKYTQMNIAGFAGFHNIY
jgi:hypothetical protein